MKVISLLLAAVISAHAAPVDPGRAAVDFLEKVKLRKLDLAPGGDTAISPHTEEGKRREIGRRLERMALDLGGGSLEVGAVREDENFAAVLVRKVGGFDPSLLRVFPVALVRRGETWAVAPVPASFENSGLGYAATLRGRLEMLENWMLREQVADLENLREQSAERMRREIAGSLPPEELRGLDPAAVVERFLKACERRDVAAMLGYQGGLSANLPDDWQLRLKATSNAADGSSPPRHPWRLLIAPEVIRLPVLEEVEEADSMVSIACLDPSAGRASSAGLELVHLALDRTSEGLWRVKLPPAFLTTNSSAGGGSNGDLDSDLLDAFPEKLRATHPSTPGPTAREAGESLLKALRADDPASLLAGSIPEESARADRRGYANAAAIWWSLHDPAAVRFAVPVVFHEDAAGAIAIHQFFSAREPDREDFRTFFFQKSADGWRWSINPPADAEPWSSLRKRADESLTTPATLWQEALLADSVPLEKIPAADPPTEVEARATVAAWLTAVQAGDMASALALTARLPGPASASRVLRNLGHEILGARRARTPASIAAIHQGKTWSAVTIAPSGTLYPLVRTPRGPKILLEIDLIGSTARGREFLNKASLERLADFTTPESTAELRGFLREHAK